MVWSEDPREPRHPALPPPLRTQAYGLPAHLLAPHSPHSPPREPMHLGKGLTRVLAPLAALNEAETKQDKQQQDNGANEANEPALGGHRLNENHCWGEGTGKIEWVRARPIKSPASCKDAGELGWI